MCEVPLSIYLLSFGIGTLLANFHMCGIILLIAVLNIHTYSTHIHNISVQVHKPLQMIKALTATGSHAECTQDTNI